jgi:hypothetical protein
MMIIVSGQAIKPVEDAGNPGRISGSGILISWLQSVPVLDIEDFLTTRAKN